MTKRLSPFPEVPGEALDEIAASIVDVNRDADARLLVEQIIQRLLQHPKIFLELAGRFAQVDVTKPRGFRFVDENGNPHDERLVDVVIPQGELEAKKKTALLQGR